METWFHFSTPKKLTPKFWPPTICFQKYSNPNNLFWPPKIDLTQQPFLSQHFFVPNIFDPHKSIFWGGSLPIIFFAIYIFLGQCKFACKNSEPFVKTFWEKSKCIEERRERHNIVNISHCVRCRIGHGTHLAQTREFSNNCSFRSKIHRYIINITYITGNSFNLAIFAYIITSIKISY